MRLDQTLLKSGSTSLQPITTPRPLTISLFIPLWVTLLLIYFLLCLPSFPLLILNRYCLRRAIWMVFRGQVRNLYFWLWLFRLIKEVLFLLETSRLSFFVRFSTIQRKRIISAHQHRQRFTFSYKPRELQWQLTQPFSQVATLDPFWRQKSFYNPLLHLKKTLHSRPFMLCWVWNQWLLASP